MQSNSEGRSSQRHHRKACYTSQTHDLGNHSVYEICFQKSDKKLEVCSEMFRVCPPRTPFDRSRISLNDSPGENSNVCFWTKLNSLDVKLKTQALHIKYSGHLPAVDNVNNAVKLACSSNDAAQTSASYQTLISCNTDQTFLKWKAVLCPFFTLQYNLVFVYIL